MGMIKLAVIPYSSEPWCEKKNTRLLCCSGGLDRKDQTSSMLTKHGLLHLYLRDDFPSKTLRFDQNRFS